MSSSFLFTSESVSEGHPDKVSDQISDAVLDALLAQDKYSRVGAETLCNTGLVVLAGEITTKAVVDFHQITRDVIKGIGYDNSDYGIDYKGCAVLVAYDKQSPDIAQGVDEGKGLNLEQGAGDQGMMFGYACTETDSLMPLPIYLSHRLVEKQAELRKNGKLKWLRPDAKSQVTVKYVDGKPTEIDTIVLSTQHHPDVEHKQIEQAVIEEIVKPVLAKESIPVAKGVKYLINPTGRFVIGGLQGDCGLTGRKIDCRHLRWCRAARRWRLLLKQEDNTPTSNYSMDIYKPGVNCTWTKDFARKALQWERKLEFSMEGWRFFDLVRWGIAAETLNAYFASEKTRRAHLNTANFQKNKDEYWHHPFKPGQLQ